MEVHECCFGVKNTDPSLSSRIPCVSEARRASGGWIWGRWSLGQRSVAHGPRRTDAVQEWYEFVFEPEILSHGRKNGKMGGFQIRWDERLICLLFLLEISRCTSCKIMEGGKISELPGGLGCPALAVCYWNLSSHTGKEVEKKSTHQSPFPAEARRPLWPHQQWWLFHTFPQHQKTTNHTASTRPK